MKKTVNVLSAAVEIRDPYTAGHESRVANLAVQIAEKMDLDPDKIEGLWPPGIHDVGKIPDPLGYLGKPTRLSDIEYELVKNIRRLALPCCLTLNSGGRWPK